MQIIQTAAGRLVGGTTVPALCLDLDGTIRCSKSDPTGFIKGPDDIALLPNVEEVLSEYRTRGYLILGISNQGGVAYGHKTHEQNDAELDATIALFKSSPFHLIKCAYRHPEGTVAPWNIRSLCRKPDIGLLVLCEVEAFDDGYIIDWDNSLFVGDRPEDEGCAKNAGIAFRWADDFFGRNVAQKDAPT